MTEFTKGPWEFIDATKVASMQFRPLCVIRGNKRQIASFSWNDSSPYFPTKNESQANARLIAEAPEMYRLLDLLRHYAAVQVKRHPEALDSPMWRDILAVLKRIDGENE